jgi:RluA family pseudouridine synthase
VSLPRVLAHTRHWIALDKPPGTLVIPGREDTSCSSLKDLLERELAQPVFTVHRLDRDTSGTIVFALDAPSHRTLSMAFEAGKVAKRYWALVVGTWATPRLIDRPLAPARRGRMRVAHEGEEGKPSRTNVSPVEKFRDATWVLAEPITGRTHQIRVHLSWEGHPLLVDPQYRRPSELTAKELGGESDEVVLSRTPLHCASLTLPEVGDVPSGLVEAPMPPDMERAIAVLRQAQGRT